MPPAIGAGEPFLFVEDALSAAAAVLRCLPVLLPASDALLLEPLLESEVRRVVLAPGTGRRCLVAAVLAVAGRVLLGMPTSTRDLQMHRKEQSFSSWLHVSRAGLDEQVAGACYWAWQHHDMQWHDMMADAYQSRARPILMLSIRL